MANTLKDQRQKLLTSVRFNGQKVDDLKFNKRQIIKLLPGVHQTNTLQEFFGASADHLFDPGKGIPLGGYIGHPVNYNNPESDFYIKEPTRSRAFYQLDPTMVSKNETGEITSTLFYEDLINSLRFQGGIVNNHDRLFSQEYFSWCPNIDLDKFLNFREYYWLPSGPTAIEIRGHAAEYEADGFVKVYSVTDRIPAPVVDNQVMVTVDGAEISFFYNTNTAQVTLPFVPAVGSIVKVYSAVSINDIIGQTEFNFENDVQLVSNLKIKILNAKESSVIGDTFIVEGVGTSIQLINEDQALVSGKPDYITIARGSYDGNDWSRSNRWFHKSVVNGFSKEIMKESKAKRPIIEYSRNLELYNHGTIRRADVNLVSQNAKDFIGAVNGLISSTSRIDGVILTKEWIVENGTNNQIRVLVTSDSDPRINNKVYKVTFTSDNKLKTYPVADGVSATGFPVVGEYLYVKSGVSLGGATLRWNGNDWVKSQTKTSENQNPLFNLYDAGNTPLDDVGVYPNSDFTGVKLFSYREDSTLSTPIDSVLGIRPVYDSKGELEFENYLKTFSGTYKIGVDIFNLPTNVFYKKIENQTEELLNDWHKVETPSRQMVVDNFIAANGSRIFSASQIPQEPVRDNLEVYRNLVLQEEGVNYIRRNNQILFVDLNDGDEVTIKTYNSQNMPSDATGFYEIPTNLSSNPLWEQVEYASRGDLFEQFNTILKGQNGFTGFEFSSNNWKDIPHNLNLGRNIVSHSAPMLRTMLLSSNKDIDFAKSISFVMDEYARFRGKFDQKLRDYMVRYNLSNTTISSDVWVVRILEDIVKGMNNDFPFYFSKVGMISSDDKNFFIPPTPSYLGIYPIRVPTFYHDPITGSDFIVGHDGSLFPSYGDARDDITLALELRIYNSTPEYIRNQEDGFFDYKKFISNKFYNSSYSIDELNTILLPMFEKWAVTFGVNYTTNDSFDINDPFTWNWRSSVDAQGNHLKGHWRGIYEYYFGTERPHTNPWEMLGFRYKPEWWEAHYGPAPYGSGNVLMWRDLEEGKIADGPLAGTYAQYAKPGLQKIIPVDQQGNLLDPRAAKIAVNDPRTVKIEDDWIWGDGAPAEAGWKQSFWFPYAIAYACYLMKPASFIETTWDISRNINLNNNSGNGYPYSDEYVFTETNTDGEIVYVHGSQQWVVDYLRSKNKNVTANLGAPIRGLDVNLAYKVGGFTDSTALNVISDSINIIPNENIHVNIYKSPSIKEDFLGGIIVRKFGDYWKIYGYDLLDPTFKTYAPDLGGPTIEISSGKVKAPAVQTWKQNVFYAINVTVRYLDNYYRCVKAHTSSLNFESNYWTQVSRPIFNDAAKVTWPLESKNTAVITRIPYGSVIKNPQEMSNFIAGYSKYLETRGWIFDSSNDTDLMDWKMALKSFMLWAYNDTVADGEMIALIPDSTSIKYVTEFGNIEPVEQIVNGVYSILDKSGNPIKTYNTNVSRSLDTIEITSINSQQMFACRLYVSEIEHVITIDNETIFGDTIYSPLFDIRQERLRLQGFKTANWNGRVEAPGFILIGNKIVPNFEKTVENVRTMFNIEVVDDTNLNELAKTNFGFIEKPYMKNLLLTPTSQFEYYQGMIQQKGTLQAMKKIFRNTSLRQSEDIKVLEEWGFRVSQYGATQINKSTDFMIKQGDFKNNPQMIQFTGNGQGGWDLGLGWDKDHFDYVRTTETSVHQFSINGIGKIKLTNKGEGYSSVPSVVLDSPDQQGVVLKANLDWTKSIISSIDIIKGGTGYHQGDAIELDGIGYYGSAIIKTVDYSGSKILSAFIIPNEDGSFGAGSGYEVGQMISFVGGNNMGRGKVVEVSSTGAILKIEITEQGYNYSSDCIPQFTGGNNSAFGKIGMNVSGGRISSIEILNPGQGYDPTTTYRINRGSGAVLQINVSGASLGSVEVLSAGGGFISIPNVIISGGNPTVPAIAEAIIEQPNQNNFMNIIGLKKANGAILKTIKIKINNAFGGIQPILNIGDSSNNSRYVSEFDLSIEDAVTINFDDGEIITNYEEFVTAYFENVADSGSIEITSIYDLTPAYYASLFSGITNDNVTVIYDLFDNETGGFIYRDDRWVWRHESKEPDWVKRRYVSKEKGTLPTAGFVHLDDINWTATNSAEFNALFRSKQANDPSLDINNKLEIVYEEGQTGTRKINLVPNLSNGLYRIKNFIINISEAFALNSDGDSDLLISIGTEDQPEMYLTSTEVNTDRLTTFTKQIFEFVESDLSAKDAIYVFVTQRSGLNIAPGKLSISTNLELMGNSVLPGDKAWVYNTGYGDWNVYELSDSRINVSNVYVPSHETQGGVISTNVDIFDALDINHNYQEPTPSTASLNPTFYSDIEQAEARLNRVILDGIEPNSNVSEMLLNTYQAKIANSVRVYIDASQLIKTQGNSLVQIPIMDAFGDTGMVINKITASVVRPFGYPAGNNPTLSLGTLSDPDRFISAVNSEDAFKQVKDAPVRPNFSYSSPITVNVYDDYISLGEQTNTANIRLLRSGNIFVTPTAIKVTNPGYGYTSTSNPKITISGPTGVSARAKIVGKIIGYAITNPGSGYTSAPTITIIGGGGTGARGTAVLSGDKLSAINIPVTASSSAVATVSNGQVTNVVVNGGGNWDMTPIVTFEGGGATKLAAASVTMNGGSISEVNIDFGGEGYTSVPTVRFNPTTGADYTSEPRVVISGGGGSGATAEPIMLWMVESINIMDWGKCSWLGGTSTVTVESPVGGAPAQAVLLSNPETLEPTVIKQWRYRLVEPTTNPTFGQWVYSTDPVEFTPPDVATDSSYWLQTINIPLVDVDQQTLYEFEIPEYVIDPLTGLETGTINIDNGQLGTSVYSQISVYNTIAGAKDIDLKVAGTKPIFYLNDRINSDTKIIAYYNSDGVSEGVITLNIDYHYTNGFELIHLNGNPVKNTITGSGGDIFAWNKLRFDNISDIDNANNTPVDGWNIGDIIFLDDGRNKEERAFDWKNNYPYAYHELAKVNNLVFRSIQTGYGLSATVSVKDNDIKSLDRPVITNYGTRYTHEPIMTITGDGQDAAGRVVLNPTSIYRIKVKNPDTNYGYTGNEQIKITPKFAKGRGAQAQISKVENGSIKEILVLDGGWNYDSAPIVEIVDDTAPMPVVLECVMLPVNIAGIIMTNRGKDYTNATISFTEEGVTQTEFDIQEWELSSEEESVWKVLRYQEGKDTNEWVAFRQESTKIDSDLIESAAIYDIKTGEVLQTLQLLDPYKGFIAASAKRELTHMLEYDPAIYNNGPLAKNSLNSEKDWDSVKVGDLWWDLSSTRYLDYEIDSIDYKWKNWTKLAPGITIDVYEWVRTNIAPGNWDTEVERLRNETGESGNFKPTGTTKTNNGINWVQRVEYNFETNTEETIYYYWVKNKATVPSRPDRKLTAVQVANLIQDPIGSDIPWYAIIDTNRVIVGGSKQYVNDYSTALKIKWRETDETYNDHKEWILLRENDERNNIDLNLWNKMRDSLAGFDTYDQTSIVKTTLTAPITTTSTQVEVLDASKFDYSGEFKVGDYWLQYQYKLDNTLYGVTGVGNLVYGTNSVIEQRKKSEKFINVPETWFNERERYGNLSRPSQSWFLTDKDEYGYLLPGADARKAFVQTMNNIFVREPYLDTRYEWPEIFNAEDPAPDNSSYTFEVFDYFELSQLSATASIEKGQKVLMNGNIDTNGLWILWIYLPDAIEANDSGFVMIRAQRYRMRDGELWSAIDWYDTGFSDNDYPSIQYETIGDRDADVNMKNQIEGTLIKVNNVSATDNRWTWYIRAGDSWKMVAKQKSTIKLSDQFYKKGTFQYGVNNYRVASSKNRNGAWEIRFMLDKFKSIFLTSLERNELFFSMVKTSISQHNNVDWAFKTSFMYIAGYNEDLKQEPIVHKDQIDNVIDYLDDVKPYHVKIRDYVRRLHPEKEFINLQITDFDKPVFWDETLNAWRVLNPRSISDISIMKNDPVLHWWYENYQKTNYDLKKWDADWNPIRRPRIKMLYDRVSCSHLYGWDQLEMPWDGNEQIWKDGKYTRTFAELSEMYRNPNVVYNSLVVDTIKERDQLLRDSQALEAAGQSATIRQGDILTVRYNEGYQSDFIWSGNEWVEFFNVRWDKDGKGGSADRIMDFYKPTTEMRRKELNALISGCSPKMTMIDGSGLDHGVWDLFAWDVIGFDSEYEHYLNRDLDINPDSESTSNFGVSDTVPYEDPKDYDILIEGGELIQPWFEGNHPEELSKMQMIDPMILNVCRKPTSQGNMPNNKVSTYRFVKTFDDNWTGNYVEDNNIELVDSVEPADKQMVVKGSDVLKLFNPSNLTPSTLALLRSKIALSVNIDLTLDITVDVALANPLISRLFSMSDKLEELKQTDVLGGNAIANSLIETTIDEILAHRTQGVIWLGNERITYQNIEDNGDNTYTIKGMMRGTNATTRAQSVYELPDVDKAIERYLQILGQPVDATTIAITKGEYLTKVEERGITPTVLDVNLTLEEKIMRGIDFNLTVPANHRIFDGSLLYALRTFNNIKMRPSSTTEYSDFWQSWNNDAAQGSPGPLL